MIVAGSEQADGVEADPGEHVAVLVGESGERFTVGDLVAVDLAWMFPPNPTALRETPCRPPGTAASSVRRRLADLRPARVHDRLLTNSTDGNDPKLLIHRGNRRTTLELPSQGGRRHGPATYPGADHDHSRSSESAWGSSTDARSLETWLRMR